MAYRAQEAKLAKVVFLILHATVNHLIRGSQFWTPLYVHESGTAGQSFISTEIKTAVTPGLNFLALCTCVCSTIQLLILPVVTTRF